MTDYTRGVLQLAAVILAAVACWALLLAAGYVLIDLAVGAT
jgi:hypothetical protein